VNENFKQKQLDIQANYQEQFNKYQALKEVNQYFEKEALPLANEQIAAAKMAYQLGGIDYVQFIQSTEAGIKTKQEYLRQKADLYHLAAEIKYIYGKE